MSRPANAGNLTAMEDVDTNQKDEKSIYSLFSIINRFIIFALVV